MLIAIVVVVWPFIAICITYQSLILSVSFICLLVFYWLTSMHGHLFPLLSTIVARYPLSWTELMLGMASHHQLFAVVFVNSLMLPTPSLESTKFAGHQEATVCPNFALWLFRLLGYCKKKTLPSPWASKTRSHRAIASVNPDVLGCLLCCCGRLLAALFFLLMW